MNLQLQHVLSDITGVSGLKILDCILAGERDPTLLVSATGAFQVPPILGSILGDPGRRVPPERRSAH